jgi:hypothetical protein
MTPDAASTQPRKRGWKRWTLALACVVAVVTIVLLATPPKPEPVKVWFVGSTNYNGIRTLHFKGTNGLPRATWYSASVVLTSVKKAQASGLAPVYHSPAFGLALSGGTFTFSLDAPPQGTEWCVTWASSGNDFAQTRWEGVREGCSAFLGNLGMRKLARRFSVPSHTHYIPSTEIKE